MPELDPLTAVNPLDGRYADKVSELGEITSEYALIRNRAAIEADWLKTLGSGILPDVPALSDLQRGEIEGVLNEFTIADARRIKEIERTTNHDVKAVELWLRERLSGDETLTPYLELIHFGLTSEDVNNLAYARMFREARGNVLLPGIFAITDELDEKADQYSGTSLLAQTHGQPATPTTLGKEMRVFSERLEDSATRLGAIAIRGKLNGASGNFNALHVAYPDVDWRTVSHDFIVEQGFIPNQVTTQIESHDWMAVFANELSLSNTIMTDLARDMWAYISRGVFKLKVVKGEVGSSTMPHKVNPIDFENAESNLGTANAVLSSLAVRLPISRLQRDLSDSSTQRTIGTALGHTVVGHKSLKRGLGKVTPNEDKIAEELDGEWSVLTEAVQTVMRRYGVSGAYETIKAVSRGKSLDREAYLELVEQIDIPDGPKGRLRELSPRTYLGYAPQIAKQ